MGLLAKKDCADQNETVTTAARRAKRPTVQRWTRPITIPATWREPATASSAILSMAGISSGNHRGTDPKHEFRTYRFLFRQPIEQVHGLNRRTRLAESAEPALVDRRDSARTVETSQRAVYGKAKCRVVSSYHESVGLIGEQNWRQGEARWVFRSHGEPD